MRSGVAKPLPRTLWPLLCRAEDCRMQAQDHAGESLPKPNPWTAADVESMLRESGWLVGEAGAAHQAWCDRAALLLGPHAADRAALEGLLRLVFQYDGAEVVGQVASHVVLSRQAARDVVRETGRLLLEGPALDSERFKQIVATLKEKLGLRSRDIFHPIRLALAGMAGEGELDRVILLLDEAASIEWSVAVKSARMRIIKFCAALD
jgi:glutamyl/glutaminyl-tRNA synthetase